MVARPLAVGGRSPRTGRGADGRGRHRQVPRRRGRVRAPRRGLRPAALPVLPALHEPRAAPSDHNIELAARIGLEDPAVTQAREALGVVAARQPGGSGDWRCWPHFCRFRRTWPRRFRPMSARRQKQDTFDLLLRTWRMEAGARPLLIIVEDLHWADPTTLEFLSALVERIDGIAALAVVTVRPHSAVPWEAPHVTGRELQRCHGSGAASRRARRGSQRDAGGRGRPGGAPGRRHPAVRRGADAGGARPRDPRGLAGGGRRFRRPCTAR